MLMSGGRWRIKESTECLVPSVKDGGELGGDLKSLSK